MFLEFYGCLDTQFVYNAMQNRGASSAYNMPRRLATLWRLLPKFVILDYNLSLKWDIRNEKCASSVQNKKNFLSCIWHATQPANQRKLFLWPCVPHKIITEVNFRSRFLPILDRQFCCYLAGECCAAVSQVGGKLFFKYCTWILNVCVCGLVDISVMYLANCAQNARWLDCDKVNQRAETEENLREGIGNWWRLWMNS